MQEIIKTTRELSAILVPYGETVMLPANTEVTIMQALGGAFTVIANGQMLRIAGKDAAALGQPEPDSTLVTPDQPLTEKIWLLLKTCYDPEIPINIVDLGLIYDVITSPTTNNQYDVIIRMTLTAAGCGMGALIAEEAKSKVQELPEVAQVTIDLVFDPPWDRSMISQQAKLELGLL